MTDVRVRRDGWLDLETEVGDMAMIDEMPKQRRRFRPAAKHAAGALEEITPGLVAMTRPAASSPGQAGVGPPTILARSVNGRRCACSARFEHCHAQRVGYRLIGNCPDRATASATAAFWPAPRRAPVICRPSSLVGTGWRTTSASTSPPGRTAYCALSCGDRPWHITMPPAQL
jgi:hypothetical protein